MSNTNYAYDQNDLSVGGVKHLMDDKIRPMYEQNVMLRRLLKDGAKSGSEVNIRGREWTVQLTRGSRTTGRPSMGYLPKALPPLEARASHLYYKMQRGISFDWETLRTMELKSSLIKLGERLALHEESFETDVSIFAYGDGSGALAVGTTVAGAGPYTLTLTDNTDTYGGAGSYGTKHLNVNEELDVVIAGSTQATIFVTGITSATTITCTVVAGSLSAGALAFILTPVGCRPAGFNGGTYIPHGLAYSIPTATSTDWFGLNPSSAANIGARGTVFDLGGAELTVGFANYLEDAVRFRRIGDPKKKDALMANVAIIFSIGQARKIKNAMNSIRQATFMDKTYVLGAQNVANAFGNVWLEDPACPDTRGYALYLPDWEWVTFQDYEFVDEGEGMWHLRPANTTSASGYYIHAYDGWTQEVYEIVCKVPYRQAMLTGIGNATIPKGSALAHQF